MVESFSTTLEGKIEKALNLIGQQDGAVVALSAGVDSSLVALLTHKALGDRAVAVTGISESLPAEELEVAKKTAETIGIRHLVVHTTELENPNYSSNPHNRCYYCKQTLYAELREIADSLGFRSILDGTHVDDLGDDRPGLRAAHEAAVVSPLLLATFSKVDVREASRILGLSVWNKPAMPCLSSRIAHGEEVTVDKLGMVGKAESYIRQLVGVRNLRVRYTNSRSARIEVTPDERRIFYDEKIMDQIDTELRRLGFDRVSLDLRGYIGSKKLVGNGSVLLPMVTAGS